MAEMLTAKEVQDLLQVDRSTIYRMAEAGRLPAIKVGKQWRFPADQINNWFQNQMGSTAMGTPFVGGTAVYVAKSACWVETAVLVGSTIGSSDWQLASNPQKRIKKVVETVSLRFIVYPV